MGKQDKSPNLATGSESGPPVLFLLATIANLHEIGCAFGPQARSLAIQRLRDSVHHLFGGQEIHEVENGELIEIIIRPHAGQKPHRLSRLTGQLSARICASPISGESGSFYAVPAIGSEVVHSSDGGLQAARTNASAQVQSRLIHSHRSLELSRYRDDMQKAVRLLGEVGRGRAKMVWQPTVSSGIDSFVLYYESLLRISDDDGDLRGCEREIRALERIDLSPELDRRLMTLVLDELETDPTVRLGINISARSASLHNHGRNALWDDLRNRLERRSSLAHRLVIEITETADFVSLEEASEFVSMMQKLGCLVAIDDFGAGCGSILQLSALGADIIKIDGNFIRSAAQSEEGYATFLHLVRLATSLASTVIVEGIETAQQAHLAQKAGVDWLQGYCFGRPSHERLPFMPDDRRAMPSLEAIVSHNFPSRENSVAV